MRVRQGFVGLRQMGHKVGKQAGSDVEEFVQVEIYF